MKEKSLSEFEELAREHLAGGLLRKAEPLSDEEIARRGELEKRRMENPLWSSAQFLRIVPCPEEDCGNFARETRRVTRDGTKEVIITRCRAAHRTIITRRRRESDE